MQRVEIAPGYMGISSAMPDLAGCGERVVVNVFGDPTRIARLLGLDIELPDCDNAGISPEMPMDMDPEYWRRVHADGGYKRRIAGKIADPWLEGDPDWALLKRLAWGEVWFDIEEGIKFFVAAAGVTYALELVDALRTRGVALSDEEGRSRVRVMPTRFDDDGSDRVRAHMEAAGLVQGSNNLIWELPPSRR